MAEPIYTSESMLDALLERHDQIAIVVLPRACLGLGQFSDDPLRLNIGHGLSPAMHIRTTSRALEFVASFSGQQRVVQVPWGALLFAGTEAALQKVLTDSLAPETAPVTQREGNVLKVDFGARRGRA
jgi:hypothetical protein